MIIKWIQWLDEFRFRNGWMTLKEIPKYLRAFEQEARKVIDQTKADHVLYAIKDYDPFTQKIRRIRFYMKPMTDAEFYGAAFTSDMMVYALHARK